MSLAPEERPTCFSSHTFRFRQGCLKQCTHEHNTSSLYDASLPNVRSHVILPNKGKGWEWVIPPTVPFRFRQGSL
ncbi:MAG: hypothetical protein IPL98_16135 [Saprospiraceae bacterium]|nr:hypothetical protein [Saprospiraceae bacterium]